jgi:aspartyl-tRNA(Asn)/glutamyl-tRNA(Gln) amidotransferase subunit B
MAYEPVIGVEVHAQLKTITKLFCACGTKFGLPANTQTCPICLGMPGTLPVVNRRAVEMAIQTGLALHCTINPSSRFARKNYFYPDLPKGYQISQYEAPICYNGWVDIPVAGGTKRIRIRRAHLEEDAGKSVHETGTTTSRVDLNRAGTPLLEIVTEPDLRSAEEVVAYLKTLRDILVYLDVCDGNMEEGSLRCEPNLSLRPVGQESLGTKVELKNLNSFKFVQEAIEYEIKRQTKILNEGGRILQETRLWDPHHGETVLMRSKEEAHDYRYFPDPDLVPLEISQEWIDTLRKTLPKLAPDVHREFMEAYGLTDYMADVLTADKDAADYFAQAAKAGVEAGLPAKEGGCEIANWIMGDLRGLLHDKGLGFKECPVPPDQLAELVARKHRGEISGPIAKSVLAEMVETGQRVGEIIAAKGLIQVSDEQTLGKLIDEVIARYPQQVAQYRAGKEAVFGFLVGQVMKASGGKANPGKVNDLLRRKLTG